MFAYPLERKAGKQPIKRMENEVEIPYKLLAYMTGYSHKMVKDIKSGYRKDKKGVEAAEAELREVIKTIRERKLSEQTEKYA